MLSMVLLASLFAVFMLVMSMIVEEYLDCLELLVLELSSILVNQRSTYKKLKTQNKSIQHKLSLKGIAYFILNQRERESVCVCMCMHNWYRMSPISNAMGVSVLIYLFSFLCTYWFPMHVYIHTLSLSAIFLLKISFINPVLFN